MPLQIKLDEDFAAEFKESIRQVYEETLQTARSDFGLIKEFLSVQEACELLGISRNTLQTNYMDQGLPIYKIESRIFIKRIELNQFIEAHKIN